jgi:transcriptional regulator GlxA family with amidase domain
VEFQHGRVRAPRDLNRALPLALGLCVGRPGPATPRRAARPSGRHWIQVAQQREPYQVAQIRPARNRYPGIISADAESWPERSVNEVLKSPRLLKALGELIERTPRVMSVCTGALILGATGFLKNRKATTH